MQASDSTIRLERDAFGVATLTLQRPEVLNAWNGRMAGEVDRALRECEADDGSRVEVFSGPVLAHLMQSLIREPRQPAITVTLPPNRTRALRLYQTGQTRHAHWSVVDLSLWERKAVGR